MFLQIAIALGLSRPKTTGTISVVANPNNITNTPNTAEPESSHVFCMRAFSKFPSLLTATPRLPVFFPKQHLSLNRFLRMPQKTDWQSQSLTPFPNRHLPRPVRCKQPLSRFPKAPRPFHKPKQASLSSKSP